ncbi:MAG TPA: putative quinol monooxygenase [Acidimicrobiales bacterium]|nr:putative quinol monooxygenase [Acidimicrobiales bacterium]
MSKVAVHFKLTAQPGKGDDVVAALSSLYEGALDAEPGTLVHVMHRQKDNPDVIVFYEMYTDDEAFKLHGQGEALKAVGPKLAGLLAGAPEAMLLEVVNGKGVEV